MISWWVLAGTVCVLGYLWYWVTYKERLELIAKVPSPTYYPFIGHLWIIMGSLDEFFRRVVKMEKDFPEKVAHVRWMARIGVVLWNPADVEMILSSPEYLEKSREYRFFEPWFGDGLLISSGNTWKTHRRLIAPTFHVNVLKQFIHLFNRNSDALCGKLQDTVGRTVDIHDYMSESTVEILLETAMGVDRSTQKSGYDYAMAVMKMCSILHRRHFRPWLWPKMLFDISSEGKHQKELLNTIHTLTRGVLKKRKEERSHGIREGLYKRTGDAQTHDPTSIAFSTTPENKDISFGQSAGLRDDLDDDVGEKRRMAFLDQLMESAHEDKVITEQEVEDEINTIMFEGHDTTAAASSFFLSLMGVHQDIQEKCVKELREIFGDSDRPATFQDTLEMKYLERCIMETLRLFPPVPIVARNLNKNIKLPSGFVIPAGSTIVIGTYMLHRDPKEYPNPSQFNPDNFLPERCAKRHYYAFIPFSAGPRSCVGRKYAMLKLKILLSTVLRRYHVHADVKESDYHLQADIILKRSEGFPVKLAPRKAMASS